MSSDTRHSVPKTASTWRGDAEQLRLSSHCTDRSPVRSLPVSRPKRNGLATGVASPMGKYEIVADIRGRLTEERLESEPGEQTAVYRPAWKWRRSQRTFGTQRKHRARAGLGPTAGF